jgi:hypothetical protein
LPARREVEVLSANRKSIHEGDSSPGRQTPVGKRPGLQQCRGEQSHLRHLTAHAVDLHPISNVDAVLADQHKPAEKRDDKVLQRDRKRCRGQAENRRRLTRRTKNHQQDNHHPDDLDGEFQNAA